MRSYEHFSSFNLTGKVKPVNLNVICAAKVSDKPQPIE